MLPVVLVASEAAAKQKPRTRPDDYFDFIGCFADDAGAHDIDGWELAEARGKMDTRRCAETCAESAYFALQDGKCQCAAKFGLLPVYSKKEAETCGPACPGEEGLTPLRRCGLAGRNAVWAHSTCPLGAAFELASTLSPSEGMVQFKAGILLDQWLSGVHLTLDWGALPVKARRRPLCARPHPQCTARRATRVPALPALPSLPALPALPNVRTVPVLCRRCLRCGTLTTSTETALWSEGK